MLPSGSTTANGSSQMVVRRWSSIPLTGAYRLEPRSRELGHECVVSDSEEKRRALRAGTSGSAVSSASTPGRR